MELQKIDWRPYQVDCFKSIYDNYSKGVNKQLIKSATGCHAKGTKILMHDGSVKRVEYIGKGDKIMGDDSIPRNVLKLYRGKEQMVRIIPNKGESFDVNISHILSLKKTGTPGKYKSFPDVVNISVKDYLKTNSHFKHLYKLYRTGVEFEDATVLPDEIDPYWFGLWVGDGSINNPSITTNDREIIDYLSNYNLPARYHVSKYHKGNGLWQISFYRNGKKGTENVFRKFIKRLSDFQGKTIPNEYLKMSFNDRLKLLAGLMDSDGSLSRNGYDFISKYKNISENVAFLARSVGLAAYVLECKKSIKSMNFESTYWRVSINGNTNIIPCLIDRKKASKRLQKKNPLVTGFKIEKLEVDNYYGFELDGNHLYCMGDFTVTHNTGKRLMAIFIASKFKRPLFIAHREELINQAYVEFENFFPMETGIIKGARTEDDKRIIVSSIQTLVNRYENYPKDMFDCIIVDECFPAGTLVDGLQIEKYQKGMQLNSYNHSKNIVEKRTVTKIMKRKYNGIIYDFGEFKCTPNHPIFINDIGYCIAKEIYYAYLCYKVMHNEYTSKLQSGLYKLREKIRCKNSEKHLFRSLRSNKKKNKYKNSSKNELFKLWKRIWGRRISRKQKSIHGFSNKRFWMLLNKMQEGVFQQDIIRNSSENKQEICFGKDEKKQSNVKSRNSRKNEGENERKNFSVSGRKRKANKTTAYIGGIDPITDGVSNFNSRTQIERGKRSKLLQTGPCMSRSEISNRNRWKNSPIKALEILRQKEDGSIEFSWLDCNKIYKLRSRSISKKDSKQNYVYNLEVEGNNNYFAEGVLVHNCHHYMAKTYVEPLQYFTPKLLTGWTATPKRLDGLSLGNIFDKMVFDYGIDSGVHDGYLAKIDAFRVQTQVDLSKVHRVAGDFNQKELSVTIDTRERNALIAQKIHKYWNGEPVIAFCVDINHAYNLRDILREHGFSSEAITSDTERCPNRGEIISDFKEGKTNVLVNVNLMTEGFDFSDIGIIAMARPTQSETMYIQMIGRGTRLKSPEFVSKYGHEKCIVLDFADLTGRHSLVNCYELEKNKPVEERIFLSDADKDVLIKAKEKRTMKIMTFYGTDQPIDLLSLPDIHISKSPKMLEEATEKQIQFMRSLGVFQEGMTYTKRDASELISNQPAKYWQIKKLADMGYDVMKGVTYGQYQKVIKEYHANQEEKDKFVLNQGPVLDNR